jgi:hypothetical protein
VSLFTRWVDNWRYVKDRAGAAYFELTMRPFLDQGEAVLRPRSSATARLALEVELFAERMEAIAHVLAQRTPVDANSHAVSLESVGRMVYTVKAVVALVLNRRGTVDESTHDAICVAMYNVDAIHAERSYDRWEEVIVSEGLYGWLFEIRSGSDG